MPITKDQIEAQQALEREMLDAGAAAYMAASQGAAEGGREEETSYGRRMLSACVEPLAAAIREAMDEVKTGAAGRGHKALSYLVLLEPEVAAFLTAKVALGRVSTRAALMTAAVAVGTRIEDELRYRIVRDRDPALVKRMLKVIEKATTYAHRRRAMSAVTNNAGHDDIPWWSEKDRAVIGLWLIERLCNTTGLFEMERRFEGGRTVDYLRASEACLKWVEGCKETHALLHPTYWPTIIPPRRWRGIWGGGYWSRLPKPICLVKARGGDGFLTDLASTDLSQVTEAVNAVQDTGYRINAWVFARLEEATARGIPMKGLPVALAPDSKPPKPFDIDTNEQARKEYRVAAGRWYDDAAASRSQVVQLASIMAQARRFKDVEAFYLPCQLDFRGRLYYLPLLSPQGPKVVRGLLQSAVARPIEDETAAGWLMVHVANTFGFDKADYADRIGWVQEREARVIQAGTDPWADLWWTEADSPWEFLAACHEYAELQAHGYGFQSHLLVFMDGTCNGLQHLSAMLLDEVGGAAVNLLPSDKPSDIYGRVAEVALTEVRRLAAGTGTDGEWARRWLVAGMNRKLVKRVVMCLPYGLGQFSARKYIREALQESLAGRADKPFRHVREDGTETDGVNEASIWIGPIVWQAIGQVVVAARDAMTWMQKWAAAVAKAGLPVSWSTPDGFTVQQRYRVNATQRVDTILAGSIRFQGNLQQPTDEVDARAQRNGIAPNFVHSLDAAAMRGYVRLGADNGVAAFALVHDSYGCHAADVQMMQACLREAFVDLYQGRAVLTHLRDELLPLVPEEALAELPEVPPMGALDLSQVRESAFFFA